MEKNTWHSEKVLKGQNLMSGRYGHSAQLLNDCIYVFGGKF